MSAGFFGSLGCFSTCLRSEVRKSPAAICAVRRCLPALASAEIYLLLITVAVDQCTQRYKTYQLPAMYNAGLAGDLVRPYDASMTTFAENLKREIARVARKELKAELDALRKTCTTQRSDIAALKRDVKSLQGRLFRAERVTHKTAAVVLPSVPPPTKPATRSPVGALGSFNHEAFADFRKTLRITQSEMGRLVQASTLSVWKWETGKAQPRAGALLRIQTAMKLGKRAAIAKATTPT